MYCLGNQKWWAQFPVAVSAALKWGRYQHPPKTDSNINPRLSACPFNMSLYPYHICCTCSTQTSAFYFPFPSGFLFYSFTVAFLLCHWLNLLVNMCITIIQVFKRIIMLFIEALLHFIRSSESCCQSQWAIKASGHCSDDALPFPYSTTWMERVYVR